MILALRGNETYLRAACRYAALDGVPASVVYEQFEELVDQGYDARRAAYLVCAGFGTVTGVE